MVNETVNQLLSLLRYMTPALIGTRYGISEQSPIITTKYASSQQSDSPKFQVSAMKNTLISFCLFAILTMTVFAQSPELPWDMEKLSQPPEYEWLDAEPTGDLDMPSIRSLLYRGEDYGGKATQVFAYYARPADVASQTEPRTKVPAVVLVHGGGGTAFREWAELWAKRGYAAIAMDLAGYRPVEGQNAHDRQNRQRLPNGGPDQGDEEKFGSIDKPANQQWPYHAIANVVRAHSLIRSFEEIDTQRTAVTGISWGGYLTCIAAGVDQRFSAAVPVYGCGFLQDNSAWLPRFEKMNDQQRDRWVTLWDPSQYLPRVKLPILFVNGTNDFAYPLDSYMKSFDAVPADAKQLCVTVNMPHGHPPGWAPPEIERFISQHLLGSEPLPRLGSPELAGELIIVPVEGKQPVAAAQLHFTTDTSAINQRKWTTQAAEVHEARITANTPPADTTAWFVTAQDARDATVSTRIVFP
ncbi:MAG: alpha/beta fold hydrolase [Pirellulaceae bacterium]